MICEYSVSTDEEKGEAESALEQAENIKKQLYKDYGLLDLSRAEMCSVDREEREYDLLCCGYFR